MGKSKDREQTEQEEYIANDQDDDAWMVDWEKKCKTQAKHTLQAANVRREKKLAHF